MEVCCGYCGERLLVETAGVVVACPHCGTHLMAPGLANAGSDAPSSAAIDKNVKRASSLEAETLSSPRTMAESADDSAIPDFSWMSLPKDSPEGESISKFVVNVQPGPFESTAIPLENEDRQFAALKSQPFVLDISAAAKSQSLTDQTHAVREAVEAGVANEAVDAHRAGLTMLLIVVGTYASLLTIYLIYTTFFLPPHQLESLPDLKTVQQQGGRAVVPRPENYLPRGHELRLGQSQRYGDIRVTPLRVTRGPIAFAHVAGNATRERQVSDPVLKLWLKFENDSDGQDIIPIDTTLMFFRRVIENRVASYNVIFRDADRKQRTAKFYYMFDRIAANSEWVIAGQQTNKSLSPHSTFETFVPSEENIDGLAGEVIWRVQIRKGYGPTTGNGVTTLIDVRFNGDEITPDRVQADT